MLNLIEQHWQPIVDFYGNYIIQVLLMSHVSIQNPMKSVLLKSCHS